MNILILTPLYKIIGRESLERNTEVVHHFAKYWVKEPDVNVRVVNTYLNPGRNMTFLLRKGEIKNYFTPYDYEVDGVKVHLVEVQQIPFQSKFWHFQNYKIENAVNVVTKVFKPDVVVAHFPVRYTGMIDNICKDIPKIAVMHYTDLWISQKHAHQVVAISNKFDATFTRSKSLFEECKKLGIRNLKDTVIYSGVPYAESRRKVDICFSMNKPIRLLYAGKLIKRKHLDYVIIALSKLRGSWKVFLDVIGEGPEKENYVSLAEKYGVSSDVRFVGKLSREQVYQYMGNADIFIMPSVEETLGLVYLEAMMNGCITVGTRREGIDGIIENGVNGFLVEPHSPVSVYETLEKIFTLSDVEANQISQNARETGNRFNERDMAQYYLEEIKKVVIEKEGKV